MTLDKFDRLLKTAAGALGILAGASFPGLFSPAWGLGFALGAIVLGYMAGSPMFDPTLVGKTPLFSRVCKTIAGLAGVVAGSSYLPQVQRLMSDGHAQKVAVGLAMLGALCSYLAQSPFIAGGTGPGNASKLALLFFLALPASSCGTVKSPVSTIPSVPDLVLDCAEHATHETAKNIIDDVGSALVSGDWVGTLTKLATRWGDGALDCAVREVFGQSQTNAMASQDPLESTKASRAQRWLEVRGRSH